MAKIIGLPKLSPTMEEGTLVRWVKQEGEAIDVDDLIAEVETDKATMEFRSFDRGYLLKQLVEEGTTLEADQPVAIFGNQDDDISQLLAEVAGEGAPQAHATQAHQAPPTLETEPSAAPTPAAAPTPGNGRVLASPVVRKLARERSIDLQHITGSGPGGRIVKRDLEAVGVAGTPGPALRGPSISPRVGGTARPVSAPAAPTTTDLRQGRVEKLSQMRKTIARRLSESKQTVPHFYLTLDIDGEGLVRARREINASLEASGEKVSLNDLIIKACAAALRRYPACNASFLGDAIVYHERVDISVAVAVPEGLVTPVVRNADQLGVLAISQQVRELAARAKDKKLKPEEMQDGTFSVSNLGMFGIDEFSAVINPPEGAILAVSRVRDEPVVKGGEVVPGKRMAVTLSCDHRVIDGATGAQFLRVLRTCLENPLHMIV